MLGIETDQNDDPAFVDLVKRIIAGVAELHQPRELRLFKIDNWFDKKWVSFAGKFNGALGVQKHDPVIVPPFT